MLTATELPVKNPGILPREMQHGRAEVIREAVAQDVPVRIGVDAPNIQSPTVQLILAVHGIPGEAATASNPLTINYLIFPLHFSYNSP